VSQTGRTDRRLARAALGLISCGVRPRPRGRNRSYRRFVVLAHQRSGSTLVVATLQEHPNAVCFSEAFNQGEAQLYVDGLPNTSKVLRRLRESAPQTFLDRLIYTGYADEIRAVGMKVMVPHLDQPGSGATLDALLRDPSEAVVWISRRNKFAAALSLYNARLTGVWNVSTSSAVPDQAAVRLEPSFCEETMTTLAAHDVRIAGLLADRSYLALDYEDVVAAPDEQFGLVQQFLGLDRRETAAPSRRQQTRPLREAVANFDELAERFAGTQWEEFFC
jgi:LPS sulfotransferase NodH